MKKNNLVGVLIGAMVLLSLVATPPAQATPISYTAWPNINIPDDSPIGVDSILNVGDDLLISSISVWIHIFDHTWAGDLLATLRGPNGQDVILFSSASPFGPINGSNLDGRYTFQDGNSLGLFPAGEMDWIIPGGPYRAEAGPTVFEDSFGGMRALGTWTLHMSDNAFGETGMLVGWGLDIETHAPVPEPSTMLLMGIGAAGAAFMRRRKTAKAN